jgi:APA family basic amino acid/polyamine antiporter
MAREGLFFKSCGRLHYTTGVPAMALIVQCAWSCVLALSGSFNMLLTYTSSAAVLFGALTVAALFRLRATQPDRPRPYRCWGYPVTPILYLVCAAAFLIYVVQADPLSAAVGVALVATGIPFYAWRIQTAKKR